MSTIRYLSLSDIAVVIEEYRNHFAHFNDPLPDLSLCNTEKLEAIIAIPQKTFGGKDLYPNVFHKAACYFYFINKMHPFYNGNKRMSVFVTNIFLMMNNYELTFTDNEIYSFAKKVTLANHDQTKHIHEIGIQLKLHSAHLSDSWSPLRAPVFFVLNFFRRIRSKKQT